jgi:Flp pilus assembly protein TadB
VDRTETRSYLVAAGIGLAATTLAWFWTEQWLIAMAVGAGAAVLTFQTLTSWSQERLSDERTAVLGLLHEVSPLLASGEAFPSALAAVARQGSHPAATALASALDLVFAGAQGSGTGMPPARWPLANLLFQLTLFQRTQGGDPGHMVASLTRRLELTAELARRRDLALIQIQWQANAITLFFGIVLVAGVIRAGPFITALIESAEGRSFVGVSAALVIWGRIVLNRLAEMLE